MVCGNYEGIIGYAKAKAETGQSAMQKVLSHYQLSFNFDGKGMCVLKDEYYRSRHYVICDLWQDLIVAKIGN